MKIKLKHGLVAVMSSMTVASVAVAGNNDRALFTEYKSPPDYSTLMVRAGIAKIDEALGRIVPEPYRVLVDESIPESLYLVWGDGDNWMDVLRRSLAPIGLVAIPDWAKNSIMIAWSDRGAETGKVAAGFDTPVVSKPAGDFVVVKQMDGASAAYHHTIGDFVVVEQSAQSPESVAQDPTKQPKPLVLAVFETKAKAGELPNRGVMRRLMQAVINGERIVLSGISSAIDEKLRNRYGNTYANSLREKLLSVGFPDSAVVVAKEEVSFGKSYGVKIEIVKGNLQ